MLKHRSYEYIIPNVVDQEPNVFSPLNNDAWQDTKNGVCILLDIGGKEYAVDPFGSMPVLPSGDLNTPIILWNARTGEFRRIYDAGPKKGDRWEVVTNRCVFGTAWSQIMNKKTDIDDVWVVCEPGNYMDFTLPREITIQFGMNIANLPVGRRYLRSKSRRWERSKYIPAVNQLDVSPSKTWNSVFYGWNAIPYSEADENRKALSLLNTRSGGGINASPENRGFYVLKTREGYSPDEYGHVLKDYEYPLLHINNDVREVAVRPHNNISPGELAGWYELNSVRDKILLTIDLDRDEDVTYPSYEAPGVLEDVNGVYLPAFKDTSLPSYRGWTYKQDALYSLFKKWIYDENTNINLPYIYDWWGVREKWTSYRQDFVLSYAIGENSALPITGNPQFQLSGSLMFGYALYDMLYPLVNDTMLFQDLNDDDDDVPAIFQNPADRYDQIDPTGIYLDHGILKKVEALAILFDHYHRKQPIPTGKQELLEAIGLNPPFHIDEHDRAGDRKVDKVFKAVLKEYFDQWYRPIEPGVYMRAFLEEEGYHAEWVGFTYQPREFGTKEKATVSKTNAYVLIDETVGHVRVFSLTMVIPPDPILVESSKIRGEKTYILIEDFRTGVWKHTAYMLVDKPKRARISQQTGYVLIAN